MAKHLSHIEVERTFAVSLLEGEVGIAGCFANNIKRSALTFCYLAYVFDVLFVDEQAHAFLTFVGDDFLCRKGGVANGKFCHINKSTALFYELGQTVHVAGASMVVDADNGIYFFFAKCAHEVAGTLLHFRVGTLYGVEFDATGITAGLYA